MTLNPDFSFFFMFQAIFDRRQNLTFDIGAFLKNPNLLVIPKSWFTVNFTMKSKGKNSGRKNTANRNDWILTILIDETLRKKVSKGVLFKGSLCTQYYFTQHHLQFLLTKVLLSWRPFGNWSHKTHCGKPTFV